MDRNTITGFLLIFAMVIVYQLYFVPVPEVSESANTTTAPAPEQPEEVIDLPGSEDINAADSTYVSQTVLLSSDELDVEISTDGANLGEAIPELLGGAQGAPFAFTTHRRPEPRRR